MENKKELMKEVLRFLYVNKKRGYGIKNVADGIGRDYIEVKNLLTYMRDNLKCEWKYKNCDFKCRSVCSGKKTYYYYWLE